MPLLRVNGAHLNVEVSGKGPPVVLLHGLNGNLKDMQPEADRLKDSFTVIRMDTRGHGLSEKPRRSTREDLVEDVVGVLDQLNVQRAHVVGFSAGSYLAQEVAVAHPDRINKLVLIATKSNGERSSSKAMEAAHAKRLQRLPPKERPAYLLMKMIGKPAREDLRELRAKTKSTLTPLERHRAAKVWEDFDTRPRLPGIWSETLILSGGQDPLNPPEAGKEVAQAIPHSQYVEFKDAGHFIPFEVPPAYLEKLESFLRKPRSLLRR